MRRDYFTCVFLACIAASLIFVWLLPLYYTYGLTVPRAFGTAETIASFVYAAVVLIVIPVYAAWRKKLWMSLGLACYGVLAYLPVRLIPKMTDSLAGKEAGIGGTIAAFLLKCIYGMVNAPFAALSKYLGAYAEKLSRWILPVSLISYIFVQLFRFYRDAYVAEQLDPKSVVDSTAKEHNRSEEGHKVRKVKAPEVLGTVITAPVQERRMTVPADETGKAGDGTKTITGNGPGLIGE